MYRHNNYNNSQIQREEGKKAVEGEKEARSKRQHHMYDSLRESSIILVTSLPILIYYRCIKLKCTLYLAMDIFAVQCAHTLHSRDIVDCVMLVFSRSLMSYRKCRHRSSSISIKLSLLSSSSLLQSSLPLNIIVFFIIFWSHHYRKWDV